MLGSIGGYTTATLPRRLGKWLVEYDHWSGNHKVAFADLTVKDGFFWEQLPHDVVDCHVDDCYYCRWPSYTNPVDEFADLGDDWYEDSPISGMAKVYSDVYDRYPHMLHGTRDLDLLVWSRGR